MTVITSTQNKKIKQIRKLKSRRGRKKANLCFFEGIQVVLRALEADFGVKWIVVCPEFLESDVAWEAVDDARADDSIEVFEVTAEVFSNISSRDNPAGLAAVAGLQFEDISDLAVSHDSFFAVLCETNDPGNMGTILRTADSFGAAGVMLVGNTTDPYDPAAIRASVGTVFTLPVVRLSDIEQLFDAAEKFGLSLIATSAHASSEINEASFDFPCAVLLGSEKRGLAEKTIDRADLQVKIPMKGEASSLNLSVAAGIILHEVQNQCPNS